MIPDKERAHAAGNVSPYDRYEERPVASPAAMRAAERIRVLACSPGYWAHGPGVSQEWARIIEEDVGSPLRKDRDESLAEAHEEIARLETACGEMAELLEGTKLFLHERCRMLPDKHRDATSLEDVEDFLARHPGKAEATSGA